MSCLGVSHVVGLTGALRHGLRPTVGGVARTIPAVELARVVRAWMGSVLAEGHGEVIGEEIPPAWVTGSDGYVEALCHGIGLEMNNDGVLWKR